MDKGSCPEFVVQSADFEDSAAFFNFRKRRSRPGALLLAGPPHVVCAHGEYSEYPASTLVPRQDY